MTASNRGAHHTVTGGTITTPIVRRIEQANREDLHRHAHGHHKAAHTPERLRTTMQHRTRKTA